MLPDSSLGGKSNHPTFGQTTLTAAAELKSQTACSLLLFPCLSVGLSVHLYGLCCWPAVWDVPKRQDCTTLQCSVFEPVLMYSCRQIKCDL